MVQLHFNLSNYYVKKGDQFTQLLRKEFHLLQYLYDHANQPFTRDQLLDAVWPMEMPSDRTVDDHIYRLRKKLKPWISEIKIETIKGFGYQLTCEKAQNPSSLSKNEDFQMLSNRLLSLYHLYGHGEAIEKIIQQSEFGITVPPHFHKIISFMKGDFWSLIHDHENLDDNLYFLLNIYQTLTHDYKKTIHYYKKGIQEKLFSTLTLLEAQTLGLLSSYIMSRDFKSAKEHTKNILLRTPEVTEPDHGYYPFFMNMQLIIALCEDDTEGVQKVMETISAFLQERPYKRELGIFHILEGSFLMQSGDTENGRQKVEDGFNIIKQSHFTSHLYYAIDLADLLLADYVHDPQLHKRVLDMRYILLQESQTEEVVSAVKEILDKKIGDV